MNDEISANVTDYAVSITKSVLGAVPIAGSFLAELAGTVIPRQRADRLADFARGLAGNLSTIDQSVLRAKLTNENFTDLLEEGACEAVRAVSSERREYIAQLVSSGLTEDKISYVESKHLLRRLSQLNDIEIIWLRFYDCPLMYGDHDFRSKHASILRPIAATLGSGPDVIDQQALQQNYLEHLVSHGLLLRPLKVDSKTVNPSLIRFEANGNLKAEELRHSADFCSGKLGSHTVKMRSNHLVARPHNNMCHFSPYRGQSVFGI